MPLLTNLTNGKYATHSNVSKFVNSKSNGIDERNKMNNYIQPENKLKQIEKKIQSINPIFTHEIIELLTEYSEEKKLLTLMTPLNNLITK